MSNSVASGGSKRIQLPPVKLSQAQSLSSAMSEDGSVVELNDRLKEVFNRHICGDIFGSSTGDSLLGLMYRARMSESMGAPSSSVQGEENDDVSTTGEDSVTTIEIIDDSDDEADDLNQHNNARQQLALTIRNWSKHRENHDHIMKEGAVQALIALAGVDDQVVKKACGSAFTSLSSVEGNRFTLIKLGAGTGVKSIQIRGGGIRRWSVAKSCALTMCYLSMEAGGEDKLASEGAVSCLSGLIGVKGFRLQPVCVQAMYNMTCVAHVYDQMERIPKILLMLSPLPSFDPTDVIVKMLVNCARFEELRPRIIEDGAFNFFVSLLSNVGYKENRGELVLYIARCLRAMSDTKICRPDMIAKGCIELLQQLLPFCGEEGFQLVITTLRNLLRIVSSIPSAIFEVAVNVACELIMASADELVLQYASSCVYIFTQERMRNIPRLVVRTVKNLPKLLGSTEPLTQFYAIAASGNIFFNTVGNGTGNMDVLLQKFVLAGHTASDTNAIRAMAIALAKMSKENDFMAILEKQGLLQEVLDIVLKLIAKMPDDDVVQESTCIAACSVTLALKTVPLESRETIARMYTGMLMAKNDYVLKNSVAAIRALIAAGFGGFEEEATEALVSRITAITREKSDAMEAAIQERRAQALLRVERNDDEDSMGTAAAGPASTPEEDQVSHWEDICRLCCAVLAVLSYKQESHTTLAHDDAIDVLFSLTRSGDAPTRELAAVCLCNMSIGENTRAELVGRGILEVLSALSGNTSELIQELISRCICNLACTTDVHHDMMEKGVLKTLNMIALVRTVHGNTKRLCARAFLNLITEDNMDAMVDAGVVRTLAALSTVDEPRTQFLCARGFLVFTAHAKGRLDLVSRRHAQQALYNMVHLDDMRTLIVVGKAVCNMLACDESCMSAVHSGALSCLKVS